MILLINLLIFYCIFYYIHFFVHTQYIYNALFPLFPKKSKKITLEFETNFRSQDKIIFVAKK